MVRANWHDAPVPTLIVDTPEGIRLRTELAGVGSRLAAALLDLILVAAGYTLLLLLLVLANAILHAADVPLVSELTRFVVGLMAGGMILVVLLFLVLCPLFLGGQTPGKRTLKIHVVAGDGSPASATQHLLRGLVWPIDAVLWLPVPLGLMLISITPGARRLGDVAASTLVVCEPDLATSEEPWPEESWSLRAEKHLSLTPGMAARLSEEDLAFLRDAILRREMPSELRDALYREVVEHYAERLGFEASDRTRLCLKELYLFARESRRA